MLILTLVRTSSVVLDRMLLLDGMNRHLSSFLNMLLSMVQSGHHSSSLLLFLRFLHQPSTHFQQLCFEPAVSSTLLSSILQCILVLVLPPLLCYPLGHPHLLHSRLSSWLQATYFDIFIRSKLAPDLFHQTHTALPSSRSHPWNYPRWLVRQSFAG